MGPIFSQGAPNTKVGIAPQIRIIVWRCPRYPRPACGCSLSNHPGEFHKPVVSKIGNAMGNDESSELNATSWHSRKRSSTEFVSAGSLVGALHDSHIPGCECHRPALTALNDKPGAISDFRGYSPAVAAGLDPTLDPTSEKSAPQIPAELPRRHCPTATKRR